MPIDVIERFGVQVLYCGKQKHKGIFTESTQSWTFTTLPMVVKKDAANPDQD